MSAHSAALGIGPANFHTTHRGLMKKGNLITVTLVYVVYVSSFTTKILYFSFYVINIFRCKFNKNIYSLRDSTDSSCSCLVQEKNGIAGRSEELLWVQQSDILAEKCLLRQFPSVRWKIPSGIKHSDYVRPDKSATPSSPSHLRSICDSWKSWEVRWWCQTEFSVQRNSGVDAAQCFRFRKRSI